MKIGQFAKENDLSIDAVRYYIEVGLILPERSGTQYQFDERCQHDVQRIRKYKEMGYSIQEILTLFHFFRLGKMTKELEKDFYKQFHKNKLLRNLIQIEDLTRQNRLLEEAVNKESSSGSRPAKPLGLKIDHLKLMACPKCGKSFRLTNASVIDDRIEKGELICSCGTSCLIKEGIVIGSGTISEQTAGMDLLDYIENVHSDFLKNMASTLEWLYQKLEPKQQHDKTILELGSGNGFFLRYIHDDLPDDALYIAVDHDLPRLRSLAELIRSAGKEADILLICSDFKALPLKEKTADVIIDHAGTTSYSFTNPDFLLETADRYLKDDGVLLFAAILFEKFSFHSLIDADLRHNFKRSHVRSAIEQLGYQILAEEEAKTLDKGSEKYENFFLEDEKIFSYRLYARKKA